jgi:holliday junction DNA helicase RuvA
MLVDPKRLYSTRSWANVTIKVVGIDPGLAATGIGIVSGSSRRISDFAFGVVKTFPRDLPAFRLEKIYTRLCTLFSEESPDLLVIEDVFSLEKYPRAAISLGQVCGVVLLASRYADLTVMHISVREAKQVLTGNAFYIFYHQTERQPKPVLIGFNLEAEKEFFQYFITVDAIGPIKAAKAMTISVREIADAIEANDLDRLKKLKGIGLRSAQKIIAALQGKVGKFALIRKADVPIDSGPEDFVQPVLDVLVGQLGHKSSDAKRMIAQALQRDSSIKTPEALFDEVYRGERE